MKKLMMMSQIRSLRDLHHGGVTSLVHCSILWISDTSRSMDSQPTKKGTEKLEQLKTDLNLEGYHCEHVSLHRIWVQSLLLLQFRILVSPFQHIVKLPFVSIGWCRVKNSSSCQPINTEWDSCSYSKSRNSSSCLPINTKSETPVRFQNQTFPRSYYLGSRISSTSLSVYPTSSCFKFWSSSDEEDEDTGYSYCNWCLCLTLTYFVDIAYWQLFCCGSEERKKLLAIIISIYIFWLWYSGNGYHAILLI